MSSPTGEPRDGEGSRWTAWQADPDWSEYSMYPWWAVDWRSKSASVDQKGERLSLIVLVGRGWAYDDPVLDYKVMSDSLHPSPMNRSGRGVEMWRDCDWPEGAIPTGSEKGYRPRYPISCLEEGVPAPFPGDPALYSDHRPMGVRLRVMDR